MKITMDKSTEGKYEIRMIGTLGECNTIVESMENSVTDNKSFQGATTFLRKKINEQRRSR